MAEYVDGRPIPNSSIFLTKLASEYLGGGSVKCCFGRTFKNFNSSFSAKLGNFLFSSTIKNYADSPIKQQMLDYDLNQLY